MTPRVWNKRNPYYPKDAVYVGRPSKWCSPWIVGVSGTREEVLEMYRRALPQILSAKDGEGRLILDLEELRGKDLVCWCAPLPCHADLLLEVANA